jgi:CheY-like chemotaxis protein
VLVIDDEPILGRSIARVLDPSTTCSSPPARARRCSRGGENFDLILCDVMISASSS